MSCKLTARKAITSTEYIKWDLYWRHSAPFQGLCRHNKTLNTLTCGQVNSPFIHISFRLTFYLFYGSCPGLVLAFVYMPASLSQSWGYWVLEGPSCNFRILLFLWFTRPASLMLHDLRAMAWLIKIAGQKMPDLWHTACKRV